MAQSATFTFDVKISVSVGEPVLQQPQLKVSLGEPIFHNEVQQIPPEPKDYVTLDCGTTLYLGERRRRERERREWYTQYERELASPRTPEQVQAIQKQEQKPDRIDWKEGF